MEKEASSALISRPLESPICHISRPHRVLSEVQGYVPAATFLRHAETLAELLPQGQYAVNLCGNRYLFMLSMCAIILKRQTNLFPPNKNPATQTGLAQRYPDTYVVHDGTEVAPGIENLNLEQLPAEKFSREASSGDVPRIPSGHLAAISFTSGSTGQSKPNYKSWHCLTEGARINSSYMLDDSLIPGQVVTTVPGQHMWGLEATVMQAMTQDICMSDASPLFPKDIQALLSQLQAPRILVSAPVHLRAMVMSGLEFPEVKRVLCATAPLDREIAEKAEACFNGELREIYGCSEVGSMAYRRTAREPEWKLFSEIQMKQSGGKTIAAADHVPDQIEMQDMISFVSDGRFRLEGRQSDMIEIAGKRGSLKELNAMLMKIDGLRDGVIFLPEQNRTVPRLVALVVMEEGACKSRVADYFRLHLDNAFVPRPTIQVAALPREENGKLPRKNVVDFYNKISAQGA